MCKMRCRLTWISLKVPFVAHLCKSNAAIAYFGNFQSFTGRSGTTSGNNPHLLTHNWTPTPGTCLRRNELPCGAHGVKQTGRRSSTDYSAKVFLPRNSPTAAGDSQPARHLIGLHERRKHLTARLVSPSPFVPLSPASSSLTATEGIKRKKVSLLVI